MIITSNSLNKKKMKLNKLIYLFHKEMIKFNNMKKKFKLKALISNQKMKQ